MPTPTHPARFDGGPKDGTIEDIDIDVFGPSYTVKVCRTKVDHDDYTSVNSGIITGHTEIGTYQLKGKYGTVDHFVWVYQWCGWETYP